MQGDSEACPFQTAWYNSAVELSMKRQWESQATDIIVWLLTAP